MDGPRSCVRLVLHDPFLLLIGVGDGDTAGGFYGGEGCAGRPAEVDEGAGGDDGGAADASQAMNADSLACLEAAGEVAHERLECLRIGWELVIGNGVVEELHAELFGHETFVTEHEHFDLIFTEKRNQRVDAGALQVDQLTT